MDLQYITPADGEFYENEHGLICYRTKNCDYKRVAVLKMFPFSKENELLSVRVENHTRGDKNSEIGIIRSIFEFGKDEQKIIRKELDRRYFAPCIDKVISVKDEFGHTMWHVLTDAGEREFTVNDMSSNLINLGNNRLMLVDVFGNRFYINDIRKLDDKTMKIIEIWI